MLYPLTFQPILKERVWGGRNLERLYHKPLPPAVPIGESWEISDRPDAISVIANGPLAGRDLHWLMSEHGAELL
ncbi:MAG: mannose-6-phosphate isomerase, partial [Verrucomicrobia bacterium]|nr:mannose-6-phosphate isomerase [Verrucomicrobiota bacterium]